MFHICFAANEGYIKYTAVLIASIIKSVDTTKKFKDFFETNNANGGGGYENLNFQPLQSNLNSTQSSLAEFKKVDYNSLNKDEQREGFIFHILSDFVSENSRDKLDKLAKELSQIYPCEIHIHICKNLPPYANTPTYFRLFIINFMPQSVSRCLYLDGDMLAFRDLRELWTLDLKGKAVGAINDNELIKKNHRKRKTGLFKDFYFNAGFLLMNLDEWRGQSTFEKCLEFLTIYKDKVLFADQDALNFAIPKDKTLVLPLDYNLFIGVFSNITCSDEAKKFAFDYTRKEVNFALSHPAIVHFIAFKPWLRPYLIVDTNGKALGMQWWDIALKTPCFKDEYQQEFDERKETYKRDEIFGKYVGFLILQSSQNLLGYLKMPFVVYRAFRDKERGRLDLQNLISQIPNFTPNEHNLVYALYGAAQRAWDNKHKGRLLDLPHRAWRLKLRYEKYGIARAMTQEN